MHLVLRILVGGTRYIPGKLRVPGIYNKIVEGTYDSYRVSVTGIRVLVVHLVLRIVRRYSYDYRYQVVNW